MFACLCLFLHISWLKKWSLIGEILHGYWRWNGSPGFVFHMYILNKHCISYCVSVVQDNEFTVLANIYIWVLIVFQLHNNGNVPISYTYFTHIFSSDFLTTYINPALTFDVQNSTESSSINFPGVVLLVPELPPSLTFVGARAAAALAAAARMSSVVGHSGRVFAITESGKFRTANEPFSANAATS